MKVDEPNFLHKPMNQINCRPGLHQTGLEDMSGLSVSNVCHLCGKASVSKSKLKQHMFVHSGEQPHRCGTCDKSFKLPEHLKMHLLIHSGEKSHKCGTCDKLFTLAGTLKKHLLIHSGEKSHNCGTCDKSVTQAR